VNRLLNDGALRVRVGDAARVYASEHTWSAITDRYIEIYKKIQERTRTK
jgi:glycosyltransferase involved in cell wall biosynthesis